MLQQTISSHDMVSNKLKRTLLDFGFEKKEGNKKKKLSGYVFRRIMSIYGYKKHGNTVYVGQTIQTLLKRDKRHLKDCETRFDMAYAKNSADYQLYLIESKTIQKECLDMHDEANMFVEGQLWLNEREIYWIAYHDTYECGMNMTTGGQLGLDVAYFMAKFKKRNQKWETVLMPALRENKWWKEGRLWEMPGDYIHDTIKIGSVLNHLRNNKTSVPHYFLDDMNQHGYKDGQIIPRM